MPRPSWDILLSGVHLATMTGDGYGVIENGVVGIAGGRIDWAGPKDAPPHRNAAITYDGKGAWVTPGLIDCHTHLVYGGNRAHEFAMRLKGKSYKEIAEAGGGILSTVKATRAASEEALVESSGKRLESFLREGVTTIEIKSGYGLDLASERKMLRAARALATKYPVTVKTTFLGAHALPPEYTNKDDYIDHLCNEMLPTIAKEQLADAVDGFCESIGFSAAQMEKLFTAAHALGLKVKLHAEQLSDSGGAALAARFNALSADHLEYADEQAIQAMAKSGTVAVLLPGAFYMLNETRKPPVAELRKHHVPIALASDCNPGTSPVTSLLLMLNMGCVLFGLTPEETLAGMTRNAARALGMEDAGTIEAGKIADLALWDIAHPDELSYYAGANPCRAVIKGGIMRNIHG